MPTMWACRYLYEGVPRTCASLLACNRQIYGEVVEAIEWADKRDMLAARMDCWIREDGIYHFSWLGIPVVRTVVRLRERSEERRVGKECPV